MTPAGRCRAHGAAALALCTALGLLLAAAAGAKAGPGERAAILGATGRLVSSARGFAPQSAELQQLQRPYPGWKICRVLVRSLTLAYPGRTFHASQAFTHPASVPETQKALTAAARRAGLEIAAGWDEGGARRPEYRDNPLVAYGFRALRLAAGSGRASGVYVGVTDHVKNRSGLTAVCVVGFGPA